ncbi:MAG TPA: T9SS type A sorting domain-containing protein [Saprospiraceae bacterium]|nr:T9SS type A sorting domain-containing protein [Saprospiraceae bacterium]
MKHILTSVFTLLLSLGLSAQCISLQNCPSSIQACDLTVNNADLWNAAYWQDPVHNIQDLADAPVKASVLARDTCAGAPLSIRYLLYLDLDRNGTWETVVKSWDPPAEGTVNFNNAGNPNFEGGEPREFDQRPVPAGEKYRFAVEIIQSGDSTAAKLRWNTAAQPTVFVDPELPYATHKIKWEMEDNQGNNSVCEYTIISKDCNAPTVVCLNGLAVNIMPTGLITLWSSDFLQYGEDNSTPTSQLQYGIRKVGEGTGFPQNPDGSPAGSVTFDCSEIGIQSVELWCRDASGNADYCETYVIVQDNFGVCGFGNGNNSNPPTVVCLNGLTVNIMPTGMIDLWASDFLQYATDDDTPFDQIELGIRKCGAGQGFPLDGNNNPVNSLVFTCSELGTQCVELWARDTSGNADYCETYVIVQDNFGSCGFGGGNNGNAPTVVCINGLSVNLMPTGQIDLWSPDFLQYTVDDDTPSDMIGLAIRKCGTGTGFPLDANNVPINRVVFDCIEIGTQCVELWARDTSGNADYCETYVIVQDNGDFCEQYSADITPCITSHCNNAPVHGADLLVNGWNAGGIGPLSQSGCAEFSLSTKGRLGNINVAPQQTLYPLNGVTVLDLIKIKRYILGLENDLSPYQLLAADANKSGSITGFDLIELRKLLLGVYAQLPNTTSWRYVDAGFAFPNPANPWQTSFPEWVNIPNAVLDGNYQAGFKAVKVGDLDCDAWTGLGAPGEDRDYAKQFLALPEKVLQPGAVLDIPIRLKDAGAWEGLQLALQFDPEKMEVLDILAGELPGLDPDAFYQPQPGRVHLVWAQDASATLAAGVELLTIRIKVKSTALLSEAVSLVKDFQQLGSRAGEPQSIALQFTEQNTGNTAKEHLILAPQPNPTHEGTQIPVQLANQEKVVWQLADLSGKVIWAQEQSFAAGRQLLPIPAQALSQAGVYVWRVSAGAQTCSGKLVKI